MAGAAPQPRAVTIRSIASLTHRDEALHALDLASAYFRTHEPSSPLPLLIDRAKRLAPLPFLEILRGSGAGWADAGADRLPGSRSNENVIEMG